jgi:trehalose 6-phosphate phosphatase
MTPAIAWSNAKEQLAGLLGHNRFGLFSDLDGTLAPIAPTPEQAQLTPGNRQLLAALAAELPVVALISGRRAASLQSRVGLPGLTYIGNHGLEMWHAGETVILPEALAYRADIQAVQQELLPLMPAGARVEDKEVTLSIHYRQTADPREFVLSHGVQIAQIVQRHKLTLFTGKMVFEVRPPIDVDKGTAFRDLVREHELEAAIFLGDDISDLHALQMAADLRAAGDVDAWGIGVLSSEAPPEITESADYLATGVADVEDLLAFLLAARKASST